MNKQRLSKVIFFITLAISVFLFPCSKAMAEDLDVEPLDWAGGFWIYANDFMMVDFATPNNLPNSTAYTSKYEGSTNVVIKLSQMEQGCVYTGLAWMEPSWTRDFDDSSSIYSHVNVYCTDVQAPDGITVSFMDYDNTIAEESFRLRINVYFDNYYHTPMEGELQISFVLHIEQGVTTTSGGSVSPYYWIHNPSDHDYAGTVTYQRLQADPNISDVYYMGEQQMQQQQQIADQQAQQSAQQHEDLKNGFQDDTYNSNVSNAGSSIDSYVSIESNLMNDNLQQVINYADQAFKLDSVQPYANAILACSTFYTAIWNSFGEFNIVFVVILALGVAGLVLGLTRRK